MDKTSLIYKVLEGKASEVEKAELSWWIALSEENKSEYQDIKLLWENSNELNNTADNNYDDDLRKIKAAMQAKFNHHNNNKNRVQIILVIFILIVITLLFFLTNQDENAVCMQTGTLPSVTTNTVAHKNSKIQYAVVNTIKITWFSSIIFSQANHKQVVIQSSTSAFDCSNHFLNLMINLDHHNGLSTHP